MMRFVISVVMSHAFASQSINLHTTNSTRNDTDIESTDIFLLSTYVLIYQPITSYDQINELY